MKMSTSIVFVVVFIASVVTGLLSSPHDVVTRWSAGPRYQYTSSPEGSELVDSWLTAADLLLAARYNPAQDNNYHLFTRRNPSISQPIPYGADSLLKASNFDPQKKTVFLVHGWKNTPLSLFNVQMVHAYVAAEDVNLIMVDWSIGAAGTYMSSLLNVPRSGEHVATYIEWLNSVSGASLNNYHIVGHSLGGHQAGIIGRNVGGHVAYITSLDPALPGWISNPQGFQASDGLYTEVMHTNAGVSGKLVPVGDVDFYPNGGVNMPGCGNNDCSHHRAIYYMAESLTSGGFTGHRCVELAAALAGNCSGDTLNMGGGSAKTGSTGIYFLGTNAGPPFSQY
ncbi:pancreatic lipase-related protein 2-like [Helicoverpa zea]|uniref:pancreatic lipase-related protein 2-like n=1 Tax=Helicoverpa zea TaxID=7113 RepID=UPI001F571627|nr:pancreatic lipase-related protein 2-like [Helicoverpa zea]